MKILIIFTFEQMVAHLFFFLGLMFLPCVLSSLSSVSYLE